MTLAGFAKCRDPGLTIGPLDNDNNRHLTPRVEENTMSGREEQFLKGKGLDADAVDRAGLLAAFDREMEAGLAGRRSSLLMIPSYISIDRPVRTGCPVAVLDAGGTNLRRAVVTFSGAGKAKLESLEKSLMPGTQGEVDAKAFFETFAQFAEPVAGRSETLGFCFSYAAKVTPDCDARLIRWSKQIQAPEVEGKLIGAGLNRQLAPRGLRRRIVILNDTVATLLAGKSVGVRRPYSAYVGFILGTGTNTAYVERNARITKVKGLPARGAMAINVESGAFRGAPQSAFDLELDAATRDPGHYTFEKMISGAYLGTLGHVVLKAAAGEGLLSRRAARAVCGWGELTNKHLDDFCGGKPQEGNPFLRAAFSAADREAVVRLATPLYARAAVLTAVNLASAILRTGKGQEPERPVCVNVDGSTYYRTLTADFRRRVQRELRALLAPRGIAYELIRVDDSPVIGAAVAALM